MSTALHNLDRAGRLIKLQGWISLVFALAIIAAVAIPWISADDAPKEITYFALFVGIFIAISMLYWLMGASIKNKRLWAKGTGIILALVAIPAVPVGTLIGFFVLYYLYKGWHEGASAT